MRMSHFAHPRMRMHMSESNIREDVGADALFSHQQAARHKKCGMKKNIENFLIKTTTSKEKKKNSGKSVNTPFLKLEGENTWTWSPRGLFLNLPLKANSERKSIIDNICIRLKRKVLGHKGCRHPVSKLRKVLEQENMRKWKVRQHCGGNYKAELRLSVRGKEFMRQDVFGPSSFKICKCIARCIFHTKMAKT